MSERDRDLVDARLEKVFVEDGDGLARILHYLDQLERDAGAQNPVLKTLANLAKVNTEAFDMYSKRLNIDVRTAENDQRFYKVIWEMYSNLLEHSDTKWMAEGLILANLSNSQQVGTFSSLATTISKLTPDSQQQILLATEVICGEGSVVAKYTGNMICGVNKCGGIAVTVSLSGIYLSYEAIQNLVGWWKGEISGKRCTKNLIDASFTMAAGVGGGLGGATVGAILGPIGALIGGVLGGAVTSNIVEMLLDALTRKVFDLPKDVATEKAYKYLGLSVSASSKEINDAFRRLCLKYHPDKQGGSTEKFLELQSNMGIIKMHRGEM